jgi:hypothetical protein
MKARSILTSHPASVGETYGQHFVTATGFGLRLLWAGSACLIHAFPPCLLQRTASGIVISLHGRMASRGGMRPSAVVQNAESPAKETLWVPADGCAG